MKLWSMRVFKYTLALNICHIIDGNYRWKNLWTSNTLLRSPAVPVNYIINVSKSVTTMDLQYLIFFVWQEIYTNTKRTVKFHCHNHQSNMVCYCWLIFSSTVTSLTSGLHGVLIEQWPSRRWLCVIAALWC